MTYDLKEIDALCEAATKGPWQLDLQGTIIQTNHITRDVWTIPRDNEDMKFIAAARTIVPEQAAWIRRARQLLADFEFRKEKWGWNALSTPDEMEIKQLLSEVTGL